MAEGGIDDVIDRVATHLLAAHGRERATDAGEEQAEIFINLRRGSHRGAWVARRDFLFDGDGGGQSLDVVALGFVHSSEKLAGIS